MFFTCSKHWTQARHRRCDPCAWCHVLLHHRALQLSPASQPATPVADVGRVQQRLDRLVDDAGLHEGLVALDVDHDVELPLQQVHCLTTPHSACTMRSARFGSQPAFFCRSSGPAMQALVQQVIALLREGRLVLRRAELAPLGQVSRVMTTSAPAAVHTSAILSSSVATITCRAHARLMHLLPAWYESASHGQEKHGCTSASYPLCWAAAISCCTSGPEGATACLTQVLLGAEPSCRARQAQQGVRTWCKEDALQACSQVRTIMGLPSMGTSALPGKREDL